MRTLIFDTETTGMVNHKVPNPTKQPYPVQLACIITEGPKIMSSLKVYVDPGVPVGDGAFKTHGITEEVIKKYGISLKAATALFINFIKRCDRIVAHNLDFDVIITEAMIIRTMAKFDLDNYRKIPRVCTMISTTEVCKIPGKYGYKWPSLEEAYKHMVDPNGFVGAHDAMTDVMACRRILQALEEGSHPLLKGKR